MKHEFCLLKQESQKMTLMSAACQYKRHKTLDMKVEVSSDQPQFANVNIFWDTRRQIQSMVREYLIIFLPSYDLRIVLFVQLCRFFYSV